MDLVNSHGVFALNRKDITTPIRMAAFGHAANAEEAMAVAAEMQSADSLGTHPLCTVGDFMDTLRDRNKRLKERKPK